MIDYKKSGVDIQAGDDLVSWLQNPSDNTTSVSNPHFAKSDVPDYRKRVISGIGGFAALFDGKFQGMKHPVLVSCTDGVGTKVKLASYFNDYSTVGQDLVAMCANDLICTGGTPLFFLDYYATGKLEMSAAQGFLKGVRRACESSHMVLIGGGFSVGVVDKEKMWGPHLVEEGDVLVGIESSGFHSNGYSLIRKVFESEFDHYRKWLLEPTRLYVEAAIVLKNEFEIHAMAHMTGGGIDNLPRVLPEHLKATIKKWQLPDCFLEVMKRAKISDENMRETFNCGIGLVVILKRGLGEAAVGRLAEIGYKSQILGTMKAKTGDEPHVEWV